MHLQWSAVGREFDDVAVELRDGTKIGKDELLREVRYMVLCLLRCPCLMATK